MQMEDEEPQSWAFVFPCQERPQVQDLQAAWVLLHQPSLGSGRRQASGDSGADASSWDVRAAHSPVASDLLEGVFTEGNKQLPWLLFTLPGLSLIFSELQLC